MKIARKNQMHLPKGKVDKLGNDRNKLYFKCGNSSMLFCKDVTENGAKALLMHMHTMAERLNIKIQGTFILTR